MARCCTSTQRQRWGEGGRRGEFPEETKKSKQNRPRPAALPLLGTSGSDYTSEASLLSPAPLARRSAEPGAIGAVSRPAAPRCNTPRVHVPTRLEWRGSRRAEGRLKASVGGNFDGPHHFYEDNGGLYYQIPRLLDGLHRICLMVSTACAGWSCSKPSCSEGHELAGALA